MTLPLDHRVTVVEKEVDGLKEDIVRLEGALTHAFDNLDSKLTWIIGLIIAILLAVIANGVFS